MHIYSNLEIYMYIGDTYNLFNYTSPSRNIIGIDQFLILKAMKKAMNKFYFDIPQIAAQAFLEQFEALTGSEHSPLESDWDMMKIMIHSGIYVCICLYINIYTYI
jgi:Leu/Phe-tRNA-protein transferase